LRTQVDEDRGQAAADAPRRDASRGVPEADERIAREELGITADTALRLAKFFGTTAGFWMNLQARYDIRMAERAIAADLEAIATFKQMVA
jgi:plasmid maintenance system antidote protein VapI